MIDFALVEREATTHPSISSTSTTSKLDDELDIVLGTAELVPVRRAPKPITLKKRTPQPIPAKSLDREGLSSGEAVEVSEPVPRRVEKVRWLLGSDASGSDSGSEYSDDEEEEEDEHAEKVEVDFEELEKDMRVAEKHMRFLHSEWVAGRLFPLSTSPSDSSDSEEEGYGSEDDRVSQYEEAAEIFDLSVDGERFRNVFVEEREICEEGMRELEELVFGAEVEGDLEVGREDTSEEIERAVRDEESVFGSLCFGVSPRGTLLSLAPADEVENSHFSDDDDEEAGTESEQEEIYNTVGEQWPVLFREWAVFPMDKKASLSSDYSSSSRPGSPVLHNGEALLYSPIGNPWHAGENMLSVSDIEAAVAEQQFVEAAIDFFAGFDVEALVDDVETPGYELENSTEFKGNPERFKLEPHEPQMDCECHWCRKYFDPTLDDFKKHDPNKWCHCMNCRIFREEEKIKQQEVEEEKARIKQDKIWKARMAKLDAEIRDAEDEEESRKLDLMDFLYVQNEGHDLEPKKRSGLVDWLKGKLRKPSE
jgi:hypothetical protein